MNRKRYLFLLPIAALVAGCMGSTLGDNAPDFLENNQQSRIALLTEATGGINTEIQYTKEQLEQEYNVSLDSANQADDMPVAITEADEIEQIAAAVSDTKKSVQETISDAKSAAKSEEKKIVAVKDTAATKANKALESVKPKCMDGEVLTRMKSGDLACCPYSSNVCYPIIDK